MSSSTNFARVQDIESAANRSKTKLTELNGLIGTLANLITTNKTSIVSAINEVAANSGGDIEGVITVNTGFYLTPQMVEDNVEFYNDIFFKGINATNFEGTALEGVSSNDIVKYSNGKWEVYSPSKYQANFIIYTDGTNSYLQKYNATNDEWETMFDFSEQARAHDVIYVFERGYGDTLPATCKRGDKFLKQESGCCSVYTAIADDTWDSGFQLLKTVVSNGTSYFVFCNNSIYKFTNTNFAELQEINSLQKAYFYTGMSIFELGTNSVYAYSKLGMVKSNTTRIRRVTDIINQTYDTVPTKTNAPDEDKILMINSSYKRIYTNTSTTTRWNNKTYENMPTDKTYLCLQDFRIYSNDNNILKFEPLLDNEIFEYSGSYYRYHHSTQSLESINLGTSPVLLANTLK